MARFPTLRGSWPWTWIGSYCILSCITHWPLPARQISLKSKKLSVAVRKYVHTYARTYVHTDGHLRQTLLGGLCRRIDLIKQKKAGMVDKNTSNCCHRAINVDCSTSEAIDRRLKAGITGVRSLCTDNQFFKSGKHSILVLRVRKWHSRRCNTRT